VILEGRLQIADFREGTQMIMMIMIMTYLNHLKKSAFAVGCLPFNLKSAIAPLQSFGHSFFSTVVAHFRRCQTHQKAL
jgi:hypothetical protein